MKKKLPSYIVESLIVSGFDDIVSISGMNLDDSPKNSIKVIEKYIEERKTDYPQCIRPNQSLTSTFEFPPGHKIRIESFVRDIKLKHGSTNKREANSIKGGRSKKRKIDTDIDCDEDKVESISNVTNDLRKRLITWSRKKLEKPLVENKDFAILVKYDTIDSKQILASIRCLSCGNPQRINRKPTGNKPWQLSNFIKHYDSCVTRKQKSDRPEIQLKLPTYFPNAVPQSSKTSSDNSSSSASEPHPIKAFPSYQPPTALYQPPFQPPYQPPYQQYPPDEYDVPITSQCQDLTMTSSACTIQYTNHTSILPPSLPPVENTIDDSPNMDNSLSNESWEHNIIGQSQNVSQSTPTLNIQSPSQTLTTLVATTRATTSQGFH